MVNKITCKINLKKPLYQKKITFQAEIIKNKKVIIMQTKAKPLYLKTNL